MNDVSSFWKLYKEFAVIFGVLLVTNIVVLVN